ncbi:MAG: squalene--hopene cyclase [Deltaproteobacteria bacterium]|nr:squalene--hopene cyclase [Deltaproteobacteria bacterium]
MKTSPAKNQEPFSFEEAVFKAREALLSDQSPKGYWWYTLEANETIGAGFIQLMHFLGDVDAEVEKGLARRILSEQRQDGSWAIFYGGPADLSTSIECYFALRLAGHSPDEPALERTRLFILSHGGLERVRVFTKIHLALFGLITWAKCPSMPLWFIHLPHWLGISIYEFSSWARASIVPLLIILDRKSVRPLSFDLEELKVSPPLLPPLKIRNFFLLLDKIFKATEKLPFHPGKQHSLKKCEEWIRRHIERTEDIYPAMAYAALAMKTLGYPNSDPTIQKALTGLRRFQQSHRGTDLPMVSDKSVGGGAPSEYPIHQQCCISPLWDTPWACHALLESGLPADDPHLKRAAKFLISKQIVDFHGDWSLKNSSAKPGGWAFEFQNDYFPDVDDTIEILRFMKRVDLPVSEKKGTIDRGLEWLLSMQSKNGGWAAFDKNNLSTWVNKIPFSDHGACLDSPTPDITGRMIELLVLFNYSKEDPVIQNSLNFLFKTQEPNGSWRGRWGVNYLYGTWCVVQGLAMIHDEKTGLAIGRAIRWLQSVQNPDGGWGESCLSDKENRYLPLEVSVPSQTAWAVMTLIAAGKRSSESCRRGIDFLIASQTADGRWEERHFTGTGFPGHFYIRYHGYRQYFPLLALGKYRTDKRELKTIACPA